MSAKDWCISRTSLKTSRPAVIQLKRFNRSLQRTLLSPITLNDCHVTFTAQAEQTAHPYARCSRAQTSHAHAPLCVWRAATAGVQDSWQNNYKGLITSLNKRRTTRYPGTRRRLSSRSGLRLSSKSPPSARRSLDNNISYNPCYWNLKVLCVLIVQESCYSFCCNLSHLLKGGRAGRRANFSAPRALCVFVRWLLACLLLRLFWIVWARERQKEVMLSCFVLGWTLNLAHTHTHRAHWE